MGKYTLFDDYLMSNNLSHLEVLREMKYFGIDDDRLLVPALFYLGSERGKKTREEMEFTSLTHGKVIRMIEMTHLLRKLRGHNYNIYECCFLAIADADTKTNLLCGAGSLIAQIVLSVILMYYNFDNIAKKVFWWSKDGLTITVAIITTLFFIKLVYVHGRDARHFNAVFRKAGFSSRFMNMSKVKKLLRQTLLSINIFVNVVLGAVIVVFNLLFLLISKNVNEAILNSVALFFILEIDDTVKPDWDEMCIDGLIAWNLSFVVDDSGDGDGDVQVHINFSSASEEDYLRLLKSDDKVNFKATDCNDQLVVDVYWTWDSTTRSVQFLIRGKKGRDFFNNIKEFRCVKKAVQVEAFRNCGLGGIPQPASTIDSSDLTEDLDLEAGVDYGQELLEDLRQNQQVASGGPKTVPLASFDALASTSSFDAPSDEQASV